MRVCIECGKQVIRRGTRGPWPQRCLLCTGADEAQRAHNYRQRVQAEGVSVHGYGGYVAGCKCEVCTEAKRLYMRQARAQGKVIDKRRHHDPRAKGYTSRPSLEHG